MQQLKTEILIQASLDACFQYWITSDYYPQFRFQELPSLPKSWSSSDAWGEQNISGNRQLDWSLTSYPGMPLKQINWHIQSWLNKRLIDYAGLITFEALGNGSITKIELQINWSQFESIADSEAIEKILRECLENFQKVMQLSLPNIEQRLKIAV